LQLFAPASTYAALVLALGSAQAAVPAGTYQTWRSEAAQTLIGRGDAESLATAAALAFAGASAHLKTDLAAQKSAAVELAAKSNELDPENPSIGWLRLQLCANTPGCDIRDAATSMRWVDADNGAAWMATLAVAQKEKDTVEVDRILTDMAQGVRFDLYWNRTVVLLFDALRKARSALPAKYLPSDVARLSEAIAVAGAEIIPPFTPLLSACRDPSGAERRENCLKLSKIMQRGDTVAAQGNSRGRGPQARAGMASVDRGPNRGTPIAVVEERACARAHRRDARHAARRGRRHRDLAGTQNAARTAGLRRRQVASCAANHART
jgi:hypothetical protein